ncbi:MAG: S41 family peptidase [Phycisphaerae bacterium]
MVSYWRFIRGGVGAGFARAVSCVCGAVAILGATAAVADPPRVVSARPDNGDTGVDPALAELRIEFNEDMSPSGMSICGGGAEFPKLAGKPRWDSPRVLIVPVKLEAEHSYKLSVNCQSFQNFRNVSGEPAEIYPIAFETGVPGGGKPRATLTPEENRKALAALREAVDEKYSYRDLRKVNWKEAFDNAAKKLEAAETPAQFAREAARVLGAARDVHLWLEAGPARFATYERRYAANYDLGLLMKLVPDWKERGANVRSGRFDDGIGYIQILGWPTERHEALEPALAALDELRDAPALVIDVRANGGGDESIAKRFAGRFVTQRAVYSKNVYRDASKPEGFTSPGFDRVVEPIAPAYAGRVAVLIGPAVLSSNESFVLMMKTSPKVVLVGAATGGSSGNPKPTKLGNGVTVWLPSWKDLMPDGTLLEGRGVSPDVRVDGRAAVFEKSDPVLDAALEELRR